MRRGRTEPEAAFGIEIDYEENRSPNMVGFRAFIKSFRSKLPCDPGGVNHAARLTIDLAAGDRSLIAITGRRPQIGSAAPLPCSTLRMPWCRRGSRARDAIANWQEHVNGKPRYAPPNTCEGGVGTGAIWCEVKVPMPPLTRHWAGRTPPDGIGAGAGLDRDQACGQFIFTVESRGVY